MADKLKRLQKILVKKCLKGQLKPVETLDDAHIILLESKHSIDRAIFIGKDTYRINRRWSYFSSRYRLFPGLR